MKLNQHSTNLNPLRPSIKRKGLEKHVTELGYDYKKLVKQLELGVSDTRIAKDTNVSRHTVIKWRKVYEYELDKARQDKEVDELRY